MRNDFSVIDALFEMLEERDERGDQDHDSSEEREGNKSNRETIYTFKRWQESAFLEHAQLILIDASYRNIHEITLQSGRVVYLVPESFYLSKAEGVSVEKEESKK